MKKEDATAAAAEPASEDEVVEAEAADEVEAPAPAPAPEPAKGGKNEPVPKPERVWARVSVGMAGVRRGSRVLVDPTDPAMAAMIEQKLVVLESDEDTGAAAEAS